MLHTKRQVIIKMCKFNIFITAVCVLFAITLRLPKNKSITKMLFLYAPVNIYSRFSLIEIKKGGKDGCPYS